MVDIVKSVLMGNSVGLDENTNGQIDSSINECRIDGWLDRHYIVIGSHMIRSEHVLR